MKRVVNLAVKPPRREGYERVSFNLDKLSQLSGSEKFDLLRDYYKTHSTVEAIHVYDRIKANGIANRLMYKDYHNLFKLLLADPIKYKANIIDIKFEMAQQGLLGTAHFYNEYAVCCVKWQDMNSAMKTLKEMLETKLIIDTLTWEYLLNGLDHNDGQALWKVIRTKKPVIRPSLAMYYKAIDILPEPKKKEVFLEAEENVGRLYKSVLKRSGPSETWHTETRTSLSNAYLSAVPSGKVMTEYRTMTLSPCRALSNTYHIVMKAASSSEMLELIADMERLLVVKDYRHYGRIIAVLDDSTEYYKEATTTLNLTARHRQFLDSKYLTSVMRKNCSKAVELMNNMRSMNAPLRDTYKELLLNLKDPTEISQVSEWFKIDYPESV